jgi:hypothetical protein
MDTISYVNQEIIAVWERWEMKLKEIYSDTTPEDSLKVPLIYPELKKQALLFIGINPSLNEKGFRKVVKDTPYAGIRPMEYYRWRSRDECKDKMQTFLEIEKLAWEKLDFFKIFQRIAGEFLGDNKKWANIDLFFNHETNQKDFEKRILYEKILDNGKESFVNDQLILSSKLIKYICPKVIVVANALASDIFIKQLKEEFPLTPNEEYGYDTTSINDTTVPVFLASMLTGQRAMDKGSCKRLKWHIKKALQQSV